MRLKPKLVIPEVLRWVVTASIRLYKRKKNFIVLVKVRCWHYFFLSLFCFIIKFFYRRFVRKFSKILFTVFNKGGSQFFILFISLSFTYPGRPVDKFLFCKFAKPALFQHPNYLQFWLAYFYYSSYYGLRLITTFQLNMGKYT